MASRFTTYISRLFRITLVIAVVVLGLYAAYSYYGLFKDQVLTAKAFMQDAEKRMSVEALAGISMGSFVLVAGLCLAPLFMRKIDKRAYKRSLWRGVVSAGVFLVSSELFSYAEKASQVYLIAAILAVIIVSALLIEAVSLAVREEDERSMRTDIVASISSGLLFGVLLKLAQYGWDWLRGLLA